MQVSHLVRVASSICGGAQVARVKSDTIITECKRGINACLKETPPEKGEWTTLQGQTIHQFSLNAVSMDGVACRWMAPSLSPGPNV